jgi:hypothetical protein
MAAPPRLLRQHPGTQDEPELLSLINAPDDEFAAAVQRHGSRRLVNELFDYGVAVQLRDPDKAMRCVAVIDRIQAMTP